MKHLFISHRFQKEKRSYSFVNLLLQYTSKTLYFYINIFFFLLQINILFLHIDMTSRAIDNQWIEEAATWMMPPPPQLVASINSSPIHSFGDYIYPRSDRLVRIVIYFLFSSLLFIFIDTNIYEF